MEVSPSRPTADMRPSRRVACTGEYSVWWMHVLGLLADVLGSHVMTLAGWSDRVKSHFVTGRVVALENI
jgi:hypothetical protein